MTEGMVIDITRTLDRALQSRLPTGVDRVSLEYIRRFKSGARALVRFAGRWIVLGLKPSQTLFDSLLEPSTFNTMQARRLVAQSYVLNWQAPGAGSVLLNIGHSGLQEAEYGLRAKRMGLRPVYFLHDLIPITHPEYCRPGEADRHHQRVRTMLDTACGLIANSESTADELRAYAAVEQLAVPPLAVALLAPGRLTPSQAPRLLEQPYFVMLGTIEPRKNHLLALNVWRDLISRLGDQAPRLVIIGQRGWECEQVLDMLDRCEPLRGFVLERASCGDQELATWLAHAQALLFPSFAEGYGMPLVEAIEARLPVLASDLPAFREVAGAIPDYLNPLDGVGWSQAIEDYSHSAHPRRLAQLGRMQGWQAPSWEAHFKQVDGLLQQCLPS